VGALLFLRQQRDFSLRVWGNGNVAARKLICIGQIRRHVRGNLHR
jgi:hypothetical protein